MNDKIILNFLPIKKGGGLQNVLSFLEIMPSLNLSMDSFIAVVRENSSVQLKCIEIGIDVLPVRDNVIGRLLAELNCRRMFSYQQLCFTFFGTPMVRSKKYLVNVLGCAYSNLFYSEIEFWGYLPFFKRQLKNLIDHYRRVLIRRADYWIFETPVLAKRAVEKRCFPAERVSVVKMSPSKLVSPDKVKSELASRLGAMLPSGFKLLLLSGAHPNKRHHLLPKMIKKLIEIGTPDFCFVSTVDESSNYADKVFREISCLGLDKYLFNVGPIPSDNVASLISQCDAMCCFSVLESFSNNFVEAWRMECPLVVTDADWSRAACEEGALYVDPENAESSSASIKELILDESMREVLVLNGTKQLLKYPDTIQKNKMYFEILKIAQGLGNCPERDRRKIAWH